VSLNLELGVDVEESWGEQSSVILKLIVIDHKFGLSRIDDNSQHRKKIAIIDSPYLLHNQRSYPFAVLSFLDA